MKSEVVFCFICCCLFQVTSVISQIEYSESLEASSLSNLRKILGDLRLDAEVNYAEALSRSSGRLELFLTEIAPKIGSSLRSKVDPYIENTTDDSCRRQFEKTVFRIRQNALVSAGLCGRNHYKYYSGQNLVLSLHLNRTEELMQRLEEGLRECNVEPNCKHRPLVRQLSKHIRNHLERVQTDLPRVKLAYNDLNLHFYKRLRRIEKRAEFEAKKSLQKLEICNKYGVSLVAP